MDTSEFLLRLDPNLGISATEFQTLWNSDHHCNDVAQADIESIRGGILGVDTMNETLVVVGNIATGVASSALYDMIVRLLRSHGQKVRMSPTPLAQGATIIQVTLATPESNRDATS